jgi:hypothetical protein
MTLPNGCSSSGSSSLSISPPLQQIVANGGSVVKSGLNISASSSFIFGSGSLECTTNSLSLPAGHVSEKVAVPSNLVGLVVGPKGATIKRIQHNTGTYILTPSRDTPSVFEVQGMPQNVARARVEIENHVKVRTGHLSPIQLCEAVSGNSNSLGLFFPAGWNSISHADTRNEANPLFETNKTGGYSSSGFNLNLAGFNSEEYLSF